MSLTMVESRCIECDHAITNPVCPDCLANEMRVMVQETRPDLAQNILGFKMSGSTTCISCHQTMALCAHCFSRGIHDYLKEEDTVLANEFKARFDFDLRESVVDFD